MNAKPKKPATKATLRQIAKELGLSLDDITRAKADGLNPYDRFALRDWKDQRNGYAKSDVPAELPPEDAPRMTLEQIEDCASRSGNTKKEIDVYKGQLEVMKAANALRVQRNQLIARAEAEESDAKIAHAVSAMVRKFETEIPALCFGQHDMGKLKETVKALTREIQKAVADGQDEFWKQHPEG
jgi:polyhydroxyalkanoate synthesis regulator phasin